MNRFLYFLPGIGGCNPQMLAARGLLARFSDRGALLEHGITEWQEGPRGSGVCVALGREVPLYLPQSQIWLDCGAFWLGMTRDMQPAPHELERAIGYSGHAITLLDGNEWRIPLLRRWDGTKCEFVSSMPKVMRACADAAGKIGIRPAVAPSSEAIDVIGAEICAAFCARSQWTLERLFETVAALFAENYRIGAAEIGMLGLLDERIALRILALSIDEPSVAEHAALAAAEGLHFAGGASNG